MSKIEKIKEFENVLEKYWKKTCDVYREDRCYIKNFDSNTYDQCVFIHEMPEYYKELSETDRLRWHADLIIDLITKKYSSMLGCHHISLMTDEEWSCDKLQKFIYNAINEPIIIKTINDGLVELNIESKQSKKTRIERTPRDIQMKKEYKAKLYTILKEIGITKYNDYYQDIDIV